jgi:hypothetical protein
MLPCPLDGSDGPPHLRLSPPVAMKPSCLHGQSVVASTSCRHSAPGRRTENHGDQGSRVSPLPWTTKVSPSMTRVTTWAPAAVVSRRRSLHAIRSGPAVAMALPPRRRQQSRSADAGDANARRHRPPCSSSQGKRSMRCERTSTRTSDRHLETCCYSATCSTTTRRRATGSRSDQPRIAEGLRDARTRNPAIFSAISAVSRQRFRLIQSNRIRRGLHLRSRATVRERLSACIRLGTGASARMQNARQRGLFADAISPRPRNVSFVSQAVVLIRVSRFAAR